MLVMKRKMVSAIMLTLLSTSMLTLAFNIQPAKASGTIYIRTDGSIDPPDAPISTFDNVTYTLTGNITSDADGIVVERSNIIIDGAGYTLQGTGAYESKGIDLSGRANVTVQITQIKNFYYSIWLISSSYNTVSGNSITANNGDGVRLDYSSNNSISGNTIANNGYGVFLYYSSNNSISGNNITANNWYGVYLYYFSNYNSISGNNIANNGDGVRLYYSSNNSISGNTIANNGYGVHLYYSSNYNSISGNNITANNWYGVRLDYSSNYNSISGNNITANNWYGVYLYYFSNYNSISGNTIANNGYGIYLQNSSNNKFYHNNFIDNTHEIPHTDLINVWDDGYPSGGNYWSNYTGVDLKSGVNQDQPGSDGIRDTNHTIDADNVDHYPLMHTYGSIQNLNTSLIYYTIQSAINAPETLADHVIYVKSGMYHENVLVTKSISLLGEERETTIIDGNTTVPAVQITSNNVKISGFTAQNGTWGIFIDYASNCTVSGNKVTANQYGIYLFYSSNSTVSGNNATANGYDGIYLYDSSNNTIVGNNVTANGWGIGLDYYSDTSSFFHNSFVNNGVQASVDSSCLGNVWDNGYPSGGNYWSNYTGVDLYCGSYQNETGSDGIGDTPHIIDAVNQDHYPLMKPYSGSHDVGITALAASKTVVGQGYNVSISVTVENQGDYTETFNVTIYGNTTEIETREITLSSGNSTTLTFTWNTSGFAKGNYTISAYAWPVSGETDTSGNNCTDGWVKVTMPGDVTGEGTCNMLDIQIMIDKFLASPPDPRYDPNVDVDNSGTINMVEIQIAINNFLKPDPP